MYTEEVHKIALSNDDDKRIRTYGKIITYQYGTNVFKVCEVEMILKKIIKNLIIKMEKNTNENLQPNNKLQEITSIVAISKNKVQSLKSDTQKVISEQE